MTGGMRFLLVSGITTPRGALRAPRPATLRDCATGTGQVNACATL